MRFKAVRKKYRCICKFAWLPVHIGDKYIWLERYYEIQSWDRRMYERAGIGWESDEIMTRDFYLSVKKDKGRCKAYYKYFNNVKEY